jgi:hypothetical protein
MASKTYADEAKSIMNRYKIRLGDKFDRGDKLSLEAMNQELSDLRDRQEAERISTMGDDEFREYCRGGKLKLETGGELPKFQLGANILAAIAPNADKIGAFAQGRKSALGGSGGDTPFKSRVPWLGAASGVIGNLMMNRPVDLPEFDAPEYKPTKATANLVDFSRGREQTMRERDIANALVSGAARGRGSQAGLTETMLAGTTATQRTAGEAFEKSVEEEANINAQIMNQVGQFNVGQEAQAARLNLQNKMFGFQGERENELINMERRDARTKGVLGSLQGYGKDVMAAGQYDQMLAMMAPENYMLGAGDDPWWKKVLQISPEMKINFRDTNTRL